MAVSVTSLESSESISRSMNAVRNIVRALRINTRAIELRMGISLAQLFVLQQLADKPAESLNELAERTATHQSSVSVVVRRLVDRGYVSRASAAADKRRIRIALTREGEAMLKDAPTTVQVQLMEGLRRMPADRRAELAELLEMWLVTSGIDVAAPPMMFEEEPLGNTDGG
jgi:DNA-binding MarR family transcriptional regulator